MRAEPGEPTERDLEELIGRALERLPPRRAPPALERRVERELRRLAGLPWWRKSFSHWPIGARASFAALCCALIASTSLGAEWLRSHAMSLPPWFYAGLLASGALYGLLFALGAAAYRVLYFASPLEGDRA